MNESKKETWRWVLNVIVSVLTALAAAIGTTSCIKSL
ncbi:MAG: smalltalk protein [Bacteroidales bacterium]|nr:smalltalk protein [Bacteroidales bacterium]